MSGPPVREQPWQPGPSGKPEPPTLDELVSYLSSVDGPMGTRWEYGYSRADGYPVLAAVHRMHGQVVGVLAMKLRDGVPVTVDIATHPDYRRCGIARALCECALGNGLDLRELPAIWEDRALTRDGRRLRDALVNDRERYGFASWETNDNAA